ncbi:pyridoxamine 5'-phosphate oxidase family protein [Rhizobium sp. L1K21]|uniref:pyridoxamine 5'-phosphate oxidase family protein n=1 Tax=Rhizobium sp. L1K21 TaxID=2954933 RepID=UPI002092BB0F|nr:pyridoxamine 5'-phosphate oxidase family protein [Rhizobium sp. L1K21]MCO6186337.1 pyridoxamine 5'-phosphate oxidase family protein [Rhizobium sp. L1K21]
MKTVQSVAELQAAYGMPGKTSLVKVTAALTPEYRRMIEASPFLAIATVGEEGTDCSPRGDAGSVIHIEDEKTLYLPDWRGNNRIDTLANIVRDPRVSLMFLIPGSTSVMRVNGHAVVTMDETVTSRFEMDGKHPRSVVVIGIDEVYFQCARAVMRADLWNPQKFHDPKSLPTAGEMTRAAEAGFDSQTYDREWPERAAQTMW